MQHLKRHLLTKQKNGHYQSKKTPKNFFLSSNTPKQHRKFFKNVYVASLKCGQIKKINALFKEGPKFRDIQEGLSFNQNFVPDRTKIQGHTGGSFFFTRILKKKHLLKKKHPLKKKDILKKKHLLKKKHILKKKHLLKKKHILKKKHLIKKHIFILIKKYLLKKTHCEKVLS